MMKQLLNEWRKFLKEEEQKKSSIDSKGNLPGSQVDNFGAFLSFKIDEEIKKQILELIDKPEGSFVVFEPKKYLEAMYPENLFKGGWEQVFMDAYDARTRLGKNVSIWRVAPIKIIKKNIAGDVFGFYHIQETNIYIDFDKMKKHGVDPLTVVVHEIGHLFNGGEFIINSELQALSDKYIKNIQQRIKDSNTILNPVLELSFFGNYVLNKLKTDDPDLYEKLRLFKTSDGSNWLLYVLSESESYPRFYRPIKFWFANLLKKATQKDPTIKINLGEEKSYPLLLKYADFNDYENLIRDIDFANKKLLTRELTLFINGIIRECDDDREDIKNKCILRRTELYNEIISTVKAPIKNKTQIAERYKRRSYKH